MAKTLTAVTAAVLLAVTGCATGSTDARGSDDSHYPVTVSTCGHEVSFESAPSRVVAQPHNLVEVLAALGVADRVVGYSVFDSEFEPLPKYADLISNIPELGHGPLSRETVLGKDPDLLYSQINYDESMVEDYDPLDVPVLFTTQYCPDYAPTRDDGGPDVIQSRYDDIVDLGRVFDRERQAASVVKSLRSRMSDVRADAEAAAENSVTVAALSFYEGADGPPSASNDQGMTHALIKEAGGVNVYGDLADDYQKISVESLIDRQPDVIVIEEPGSGDSSYDDVREQLHNDPRLADIPAVRDDQFTFARTDETFAGVRFPAAAERFVDVFHQASE